MEIQSRFVLHAPNVHTGGGWVLLRDLIAALPKDRQGILLLDARAPVQELTAIQPTLQVFTFPPTFAGRWAAERTLNQHASTEDIVLCFGNLPPLFKLPARVFVFLHNRYLINPHAPKGFNMRIRMRILMERIWFKQFAKHADCFMLQTPNMYQALRAYLKTKIPIKIAPFFFEKRSYSRKSVARPDNMEYLYDFIYVASGEPHKNHKTLIEAWCLLADATLYPSLCLTLNKKHHPELCTWIDTMKDRYQLNIENKGVLPLTKIAVLYQHTRALIFPSVSESLGLPLLEARQYNLPVLASELDYVRDVLDPEESFDPHSAMSIARAVRRFLHYSEEPLPLLSSAEFLQFLFTYKTTLI